MLTDANRKVIFSFSGPTLASNLLIADRDALFFLYSTFKSNPSKDRSLNLYSDFLALIKDICQVKAGIPYEDLEFSNEQWFKLVSDGRVKVSYIFRDILKGANNLAKKVRVLHRLVST